MSNKQNKMKEKYMYNVNYNTVLIPIRAQGASINHFEGSTGVKIDTCDSATRPFLSSEFSTRCLLSSDGHFHKIKFILQHATFWKKNKNDMRHFNINMIRYPTPQITHDATQERADNS